MPLSFMRMPTYCKVMYGLLNVIFTGVSAKELTQIPFTSESFPSSSVASHRTEGIYNLTAI